MRASLIVALIIIASYTLAMADVVQEAETLIKQSDAKIADANTVVQEANAFLNDISGKESEVTGLIDNWDNLSYKERDKIVFKFVSIYIGQENAENVEHTPDTIALPEHIAKAKELIDKVRKHKEVVNDIITKEDVMIAKLRAEIKMLEEMYNSKQCANYVMYEYKRYDTNKAVAEKAYTPIKYHYAEDKRPYLRDEEMAVFIKEMVLTHGHNSEYYGKYTDNGKLRKLHKKNWIWQYNWHIFKDYRGLKRELAFRWGTWRKDKALWIAIPKRQHLDWDGKYSQAFWYGVRKGESLKRIAGYDFMYGNPRAWRLIWRNMITEPYGHDYSYLAKIDPIKPGVKKGYIVVAPYAGIKFNRIRLNWVPEDDNMETPGTFQHSTHK